MFNLAHQSAGKTVGAPIPLYRPDWTSGDEAVLLSQLERKPFHDSARLADWEAGWRALWGRPAVAFAAHLEAMEALKTVLGWRSGDVVGGDLLLDPVWRDALAGAWLHLGARDVEARSGHGVGAWRLPRAGGMLRAVLVQHAFGLPAPLPAGETMILEEISAVPLPMAGCGGGAVQLVNLAGPRILASGAGCVLLSRDAALSAELASIRRHPPSAAACAVGCSQLAGVMLRLQRRRELAERLLTLRLTGGACLPENPVAGRAWDAFLLTMADEDARRSLEGFLQQVGIGGGSPVWFTPPGERPAGLRRFLATTLALPLYASLTDGECKRIINRVHRWMERH